MYIYIDLYLYINVYIVPNCIKLVYACVYLFVVVVKRRLPRLLPMLTLYIFKPVYIDGLFQASSCTDRNRITLEKDITYYWIGYICI